MSFDLDVIVEPDPASAPFCMDPRLAGKRLKIRRVNFLEQLAPCATILAQHPSVIELGQPLGDRTVEFGQAVKGSVAQPRQQPALDDSDVGLNLRLISRPTRPCRLRQDLSRTSAGDTRVSKQRLVVLQSLWAMERRHPDGIEPSIEQNLRMIREAGFDGVSAFCTDPTSSALSGTGFVVEGMCFPQTIDDLKGAIDLAGQLGALHLNVQPNVRSGRIAECIPLLEGWIKIAGEAGMPVNFETHRNR